MPRGRTLVACAGIAAVAGLLAAAGLVSDGIAEGGDKVTATQALCTTPAEYGVLQAGLAALGWQEMPVTGMTEAETGLFALRTLIAKVPADVTPAPGHWADEWAAAQRAVSGWRNLGPETAPAHRSYFRSGLSVMRVDSAPQSNRVVTRCQLIAAGADIGDAAAAAANGGHLPPVHWLPNRPVPEPGAPVVAFSQFTALMSASAIATATGEAPLAPEGDLLLFVQTDIHFDPETPND